MSQRERRHENTSYPSSPSPLLLASANERRADNGRSFLGEKGDKVSAGALDGSFGSEAGAGGGVGSTNGTDVRIPQGLNMLHNDDLEVIPMDKA